MRHPPCSEAEMVAVNVPVSVPAAILPKTLRETTFVPGQVHELNPLAVAVPAPSAAKNSNNKSPATILVG